MRQSWRGLVAFLFLTGTAGIDATGPLTTPQAPPLRLVVDVPLSGPAVRFDYQSLDPSTGRLYIAHMNADQLVVFDTRARQVVATLDGFERLHGVLAVPDRGRVYVSATGDREVAVVDAKTLQTLARIGPVSYADGLAYAPGPKRIFVSDMRGRSDAVIDAGTNRIIETISLGGEAGNTVYDPGSGQILVAVDTGELVAIDPSALRIAGRFPLPGIEAPHGVALDVKQRLAFVAGEDNHSLGVFDLATDRLLGVHQVGEDPDVLAFDPEPGRLYVAAESGTVAVFHERGRALVPEGRITMPHAHSVCVDPTTHLVYFPLENVGGRPVLRIMQ